MLPSGNENSERESNPVPYCEYEFSSSLAFLISLTASNKEYFRVQLVFKSHDHASN